MIDALTTIRVNDDETGCALIAVKAVPGASRDEISGALGDRLKVRVSAAAEGGRANKAICALIAGALGASKKDVSVVAGLTSAEKTVRVAGMGAAEVRGRLRV